MSTHPHRRAGFPTPYPGVNRLLRRLLNQIRQILGSDFVGLYLYGSLALGDFDPGTSDIDFIVVTQTELADDRVEALYALHEAFYRSRSRWARKLEAAYIPLEALRGPVPEGAKYPQVEDGFELNLMPLEVGWPFQRWTLRERGLVVSGPSPEGFTAPVEKEEMRQSSLAILGEWQAKARTDLDWIDWIRHHGCQSFTVLTICRILYSLENGAVVSKPAAARWAQEALGLEWKGFLQRALDGKHAAGKIDDREIQETLKLLALAVERVQRTGG
jgi:hypothetical protein